MHKLNYLFVCILDVSCRFVGGGSGRRSSNHLLLPPVLGFLALIVNSSNRDSYINTLQFFAPFCCSKNIYLVYLICTVITVYQTPAR